MKKETHLTLLRQIDSLIAAGNQLQGLAQCLDALADHYVPGDDIALVADVPCKIESDLNAIVRALEDILTNENELKE